MQIFHISLIIFSFFSSSLTANDQNSYCFGNSVVDNTKPCRFFTIVIDGGSTGTRLQLYRFLHEPKIGEGGGMPFNVEKEVFQEVKPGLSSYANDPKQAADSLIPLLERAKKEIPHFMWEKTPITLKATAGLRLLPGDMADDILEQVEQTIYNSGFFAAFPGSVSVMSGSDEGIYSWFTLNILLKTLFNEKQSAFSKPLAHQSLAAFDLGGGSTQITYWPNDEKIFNTHAGKSQDIDFFGHHIKLFTHSFLGNGLIAARLSILKKETPEFEQKNWRLISSCMPPKFEMKDWEYALKTWSVNGSKTYGFENCYNIAKEFVIDSKIMRLEELKGKPIYLFSYFFDRGLNSGLVKSNEGGKIELGQFEEAAKIACARSSEEISDGSHWMPWQCLDITYIYALLKDGYQFENDQPIVLAKKLNGMEMSWGQGLAFAVANEFQFSGGSSPTQNRTNSTVVDQIFDFVYTRTNHVLSFFNLIST